MLCALQVQGYYHFKANMVFIMRTASALCVTLIKVSKGAKIRNRVKFSLHCTCTYGRDPK